MPEDTQPQDQPAAATAPHDDDRLQDDLYEVTADTWGWQDLYHKGQIIRRRDPDPKQYDVEHAIRTGTLRPLTVGESRGARVMVAPAPEQPAIAAPGPDQEPKTEQQQAADKAEQQAAAQKKAVADQSKPDTADKAKTEG